MKSVTKLSFVMIAVLAMGFAFAQGEKKPVTKEVVKPAAVAVVAPKCPKCGMTLSSKKDKVHTVSTKIKGKTWYCCATCKMNAKKPK